MRRLLAPLCVLAAVPCGLALAASTTEVGASGVSFTPKTVTIAIGDSVHWKTSAGTHNVVFDDGSYKSGEPTNKEELGTHAFNKAGTYAYYCEVHGSEGGNGMSGTVVVQDPANPNPTATPTPEPAEDPALSAIAVGHTLKAGSLRGRLHASPDGAELAIQVTRAGRPVGKRAVTTHGYLNFRVPLKRAVRRAVARGGHPRVRVDFALTAGDKSATAHRTLRLTRPAR